MSRNDYTDVFFWNSKAKEVLLTTSPVLKALSMQLFAFWVSVVEVFAIWAQSAHLSSS